MSIINYSQKTSVENNLKEVCNTITGSAGGWPSNTHAGILQCYDFTIEEADWYENAYQKLIEL